MSLHIQFICIIYVCISICVCVYIYMYMCMYLCIYICIYVHVYIEERETTWCNRQQLFQPLDRFHHHNYHW